MGWQQSTGGGHELQTGAYIVHLRHCPIYGVAGVVGPNGDQGTVQVVAGPV